MFMCSRRAGQGLAFVIERNDLHLNEAHIHSERSRLFARKGGEAAQLQTEGAGDQKNKSG